MRSKVTVVLLFLNVVLFFYIYQYEQVRLPDANGRRVLGAEVASIDSLTRTSTQPGVASLKLERRGEIWSLVEPYEWPASPHAVDRLVKELQFLEHETSFAVADLAKSGQTMADYGLDAPALTMTFTSAKKAYTLKIGNVTEIGKRLYVLSPDGTRIHVVGRSLADSVATPLEDLRSESIFTVPVFEVRSLNVQTATPNLKVRLRRDASSRWGFETPINARASKAAVVVTINALNALTAKRFIEPREADLDRAGLSSPALRVTLEGNARRETLLLGQADTGDQYFAKIEDKPNVFTTAVPAALLEVLRTTQEQLRDPRVIDFEPGTVTALTLGAPGQPELSLQRLEGGTGATAWQVVTRISGQAPLSLPADLALVEELLQKLYLLSAIKFQSDAPSAADLEKYGFNRPERTILLGLSNGGGPQGNEPSTLTLEIGVSPGESEAAYARVTNAPFVYQIVPDILAATPTLARHYRQRLIRELPASARITRITLTDLATNTPIYHHQLAENEGAWDHAIAAEPEARRPALTALLASLRSLRARNFTAENFAPDHADTASGPQPWRYRLEFNLSFPGGASTAATTTTLLLTERLGGSTLLAGTAEFGGIQFETTQEMLDALFALTYTEKHDPGAGGPSPPADAVKEPATAPAADGAAEKPVESKKPSL